MSSTPSTHGGKRPGAGRKKGSGLYNEPTKVVRLPESQVPVIKAWLKARAKSPADAPELPLPKANNAQTLRPDASSHVDLPLFSHKVVAGFPSPADDNIEARLDLNEHYIRNPETTFLVRVQGDSMKKSGIHHGDILVVDRSINPVDGKIVIAAIDSELTVKRLSVKSTGTWLVPENDDYTPILVKEESNLVIWGVVTTVMHSF